MGAKVARDTQAGFAGGLNAAGDPNFLRPDQGRQLANIRLTPVGAASKRLGTQRISAAMAGSGALVFAEYWPEKGYCLVVSNFDLYKATPVIGTTWTLVSASTSIGSSSTGVPFVDASGSAFYFAAGGATIGKYDGTTYTNAVSGTASVSRLIVYNQRLWGIYQYANNALYYSNLSSVSGSIGGDSLGIAASGGGQINVNTFGKIPLVTGLVVGASLMLFHVKGISRLSGFGQDDIQVLPQSVADDVAIAGPNACTVGEGVGYVATTRGLYRLTESSVTPVSTPDKPDPLVAAFQTAGASAIASARLNYNPTFNEVWITISTLGTYVYHTILDAWSGPWTGVSYATAGPRFTAIAAGNFPVVCIADSAGWLLQTDISGSYKDDVVSAGTGGTAYSTVVQPHRMSGGSRTLAKSWRWANLLATLTAGGTAPTVASTSQYGGTSTDTMSNLTSATKPYYINIGGTGPYVDIVITDTGTTASQYELLEIEGHVLGKR